MDSEIKSRWISKLRSGDYEQTTGKLTNGSGFCCLGVLCEIAQEDGIVIKRDTADDPYYVSKVDESDYNSDVLPIAVRKWAGLDDTNPSVGHVDPHGYNSTDSLAELNDGGKTFAEIADLIEESL